MFDVMEALRELVAKNGSDLHLKVGSAPLFRVNGELAQAKGAPPLEAGDTIAALEQLLTDEAKREEFKTERAGSCCSREPLDRASRRPWRR